MDERRRDQVHNLSESFNVLEYIIRLVDERGYRFADDDAPQYIAELKKVRERIREAREYLSNQDQQDAGGRSYASDNQGPLC